LFRKGIHATTLSNLYVEEIWSRDPSVIYKSHDKRHCREEWARRANDIPGQELGFSGEQYLKWTFCRISAKIVARCVFSEPSEADFDSDQPVRLAKKTPRRRSGVPPTRFLPMEGPQARPREATPSPNKGF